MDQAIARFGQDLARAEDSKRTQTRYVAEARRLEERFGRDVEEITREQVREYVDEVMVRQASGSTKCHALGAIRCLYKRTLGRPEMVSFFRLPKRYSPLPTVLSSCEVAALLRAIRTPRYQVMARVMYDAGLRIS